MTNVVQILKHTQYILRVSYDTSVYTGYKASKFDWLIQINFNLNCSETDCLNHN